MSGELKNSKDWYLSVFPSFEKKLNGGSKSFLHGIRKEALAQLAEMSFPTLRNEDWKYTDISPLLKNNFIPAASLEQVSFTGNEIEKYLFKDFDFHLLVFINGVYSTELSKVGALPKGAVISGLSKASKENPELIRRYTGKSTVRDNAFNTLNAAYAVDGLFIYVPDGKIIEKPVQVLFINSSPDKEILSVPKNLLVAGNDSNVSVIASYAGSGKNGYFSNIVSDLFIGERATVDFCKIQEENDNSYHIEKVQAYQQKGSVYNHFNIMFGAAISRNDINSVLEGENTETHYYGLYLANGNRLVDNHTFVDHAKPNCMSNELYKGILDDESRGVFNGKIIVRQDAQKTNAYQKNKTILLSKKAKIDTKPQLEIFADDVKCSHGATVGQLDEESEFYIRSRGIPQEIAKSMLIRAFANDVVETLKIDALKEQLNHKIFEHLNRVEIENKL